MVILVPLMLVLFISNLDQTIVATAIPSIGRELQDLSHSSWIATSYLLTSAVTTLLLGKLGDMYGRKRIFQLSIAIFLVGSILSGLASNMLSLVLFRALQGIGGGGLNSLVMAIIGDTVPARRRSKYQAYTGIVAMVALIAGPFLGGLFSDTLSWRWIFYINIPVGIAAIALVGARLHLPRPTKHGRVDVAGALLATVVTTALLLFTTWGGSQFAWNSPMILALIAVTVVGLVAYLLVERRAAEPITPLHLFKSSVFSISSAQFFLATLVLFVGMLYVPQFLQTVQGKSAFVAGLFVIPLLLGLIIATGVSGPLIAKSGRYKIYPIVGSILVAVSMLALSRAGATTPAWQLIVPLLFTGAGIGFFVQVALLAGQNAAEYRYLGVATGALNFFKSIGGALGAALFGAILASGIDGTAQSFDTVFLWTIPFMALSLILGLMMRELPLSDEMVAVAEGKIEVPEY
jgi:EmrB/QacA subfamily drug resistance transporter